MAQRARRARGRNPAHELIERTLIAATVRAYADVDHAGGPALSSAGGWEEGKTRRRPDGRHDFRWRTSHEPWKCARWRPLRGAAQRGTPSGRSSGRAAPSHDEMRSRPMTEPIEVATGQSMPRCRVCTVSPEPRRQPNRATHFTCYVDGLVTLTCGVHATQAAKGGGFAIELSAIDGLVTYPLSTPELWDQLRFATRSRENWRPTIARDRAGDDLVQ